ncbi:MAG: stage II sporulation protein M, partial [Candidatus Wallbacteria bacterium]|nr:stage II sporulation protein M [Candidatus Wallbacteria bacterium]
HTMITSTDGMNVMRNDRCKEREIVKLRDLFVIITQGVKKSSRQITFLVLVFIAGFMAGADFPLLNRMFSSSFRKSLTEFRTEKIAERKSMSVPARGLSIAMNNLNAAEDVLVLGIAFGIYPVYSCLANGYRGGFLTSKAARKKGPGVLLFLVPHGIFELPAMFIACGLGLRLGLCWFGQGRIERFRTIIMEILLITVLLIAPLIFVAGMIEAAPWNWV